MRLILHTTVVALIAIVLVGGAYAWGLNANLNSHAHTCEAPCTVHFTAPMEEDMFGIDYYDEKLEVFKAAPDQVED
jgi:hypothetical protein